MDVIYTPATMALQPNSRLGSYEILAPLGAGGMGEVYRARDPRIGRDVAIKLLPPEFAEDPDRLRRFEQEVRVAGSLNHPNLVTIFDANVQGGVPYFVSELLEGETLRERIDKGPLPIRKAIEFAMQIASGLAAVHERNIVHRDLKPENLFVLPGDRIKILDFGLAKLSEDAQDLQATLGGKTEPGIVLGTVGYMSPEQVRGQNADARSDIFALGLILYEMLSGKRAFAGSSSMDTFSAILKEDPPDLTVSRPECPPLLERIVRRCLAKNTGERFQSAHDLRFALDNLSGSSPVVTQTISPSAPRSRWLRLAMTAVAAVAVVAATWFIARRGMNAGNAGVVWTSILPPEREFTLDPDMALSADGKRIVFRAPDAAGKLRLWVRSFDALTPQVLPGTENGILPFWSPDARSIGFFAQGKLLRLDLAGGDPQALADAASPEGGTWNSNGVILFNRDAGALYRVSAAGQDFRQVTKLDAAAAHDLGHSFPRFLPDGRHFLCWVSSYDKGREGLYAGDIETAELIQIGPWRSRGEYANGYIFYGRNQDLMAAPFDPARLRITGDAVRVAGGAHRGSYEFGNYAYSVAASGTIAYSTIAGPFALGQLTWLDRSGHVLERLLDPGVISGIALSPNGQRLAVESNDMAAGTDDIWFLDLKSGNPSRQTFEAFQNGDPLWAPDSERILFTTWSDRLHVRSIREGKVEEVPLSGGSSSDYPLSWSSDGRFLLFGKAGVATSRDLWVLPLSGDRTPRPYLNGPFSESSGRISPDSHWVAYVSDESGRNEIYLQSFPEPAHKIRVSSDGGDQPMWRSDGKELYFISPDSALMVASIVGGASPEPSRPAKLFTPPTATPFLASYNDRMQYAPSLDGQRFLMLLKADDHRKEAIQVIFNWSPPK